APAWTGRTRRHGRGSRRSDRQSGRRSPARPPPQPPSPVALRLELIFELAAAIAADVGFIVLRPAILTFIEERIENAAAHIALDFVTRAVRANALARFELAERGGVDAQPRQPQEGDHAAVEIHLTHIERRDTAVLAGGDYVLTSQRQNLLAQIREALLWKGGLVTGTFRGGIVRQEAGLLPEVFAGVVGVLSGQAHG